MTPPPLDQSSCSSSGAGSSSLCSRDRTREDAGVQLAAAKTGEFTIGHAVATRADVDALLAHAQTVGATLTGEAHDRAWGIYSGFFHDPDGHLWEIMWNPALDLDTTG